jgi:hypothetical protein
VEEMAPKQKYRNKKREQDENLNLEFFDESKQSEAADEENSKPQNFEFIDSLSLMRLIRLFLFLQVISILVDHNLIFIPPFFQVTCHGLFYYLIHFYSRPFLDLIYIIQFYIKSIKDGIDQVNSRSNQESGHVRTSATTESHHTFRRLTGLVVSHICFNFVQMPFFLFRDDGFGVAIDFLDERYWHAAKAYSHFFLGLFFVYIAIIFTVYTWEILDFSNRLEIRAWLREYVADGWWRRGGLTQAKYLAYVLITITLLLFIAYVLGHGVISEDTIPTKTIVGSLIAVLICVFGVLIVIGFFSIRTVEKVFTRYVSQNVNYTSVVILKKISKVKVELGIFFMLILITPVLYSLLKAAIGEGDRDWLKYTSICLIMMFFYSCCRLERSSCHRCSTTIEFLCSMLLFTL